MDKKMFDNLLEDFVADFNRLFNSQLEFTYMDGFEDILVEKFQINNLREMVFDEMMNSELLASQKNFFRLISDILNSKDSNVMLTDLENIHLPNLDYQENVRKIANSISCRYSTVIDENRLCEFIVNKNRVLYDIVDDFNRDLKHNLINKVAIFNENLKKENEGNLDKQTKILINAIDELEIHFLDNHDYCDKDSISKKIFGELTHFKLLVKQGKYDNEISKIDTKLDASDLLLVKIPMLSAYEKKRAIIDEKSLVYNDAVNVILKNLVALHLDCQDDYVAGLINEASEELKIFDSFFQKDFLNNISKLEFISEESQFIDYIKLKIPKIVEVENKFNELSSISKNGNFLVEHANYLTGILKTYSTNRACVSIKDKYVDAIEMVNNFINLKASNVQGISSLKDAVIYFEKKFPIVDKLMVDGEKLKNSLNSNTDILLNTCNSMISELSKYSLLEEYSSLKVNFLNIIAEIEKISDNILKKELIGVENLDLSTFDLANDYLYNLVPSLEDVENKLDEIDLLQKNNSSSMSKSIENLNVDEKVISNESFEIDKLVLKNKEIANKYLNDLSAKLNIELDHATDKSKFNDVAIEISRVFDLINNDSINRGALIIESDHIPEFIYNQLPSLSNIVFHDRCSATNDYLDSVSSLVSTEVVSKVIDQMSPEIFEMVDISVKKDYVMGVNSVCNPGFTISDKDYDLLISNINKNVATCIFELNNNNSKKI